MAKKPEASKAVPAPAPVARKLGIGILGYGPWGAHVARIALNSTRAWVPMIWTRSPETADKIRAAGFPASNDLDEVIDHPDVEAVAVMSPNALHVEHCLKVCAAGKALFATKPLVLTLEDYDKILEAIEKSGVKNHADFGMRYGAAPRKLIEMTDAGEFGEPMHLISRNCRGTGLYSLNSVHKAVKDPAISGGWILHHMCHQVDFAIRLTRQRVMRVYCQTVKSAPECPSEESISAILTTERGCILELADGVAPQTEHHLSLLGTKALAYVNAEGQINYRGECKESFATRGFGGHSLCFTPEGWADDSLVAFISMITGVPHGRHYPLTSVPIAEGRHTLEALLAMRESARTNKPVEV
jgi:predicted dehydrogenase